jgi:hypothetical protein
MSIILDGIKVNRTEEMVWKFQHSITKRKILLTWRRDKGKFLRSLIRDEATTSKQTPSYAVQFYRGFRSLLWQSYAEEFPGEKPDIDQLCDWLEDNSIISNHFGKQSDRNTWLDIWRCVRILIDGNLE